jgi:hypothetical protein
MLSLLNIRSKWSTAQVFAHFVVEVLGQKDNSRSHTFIFKLMDYSACVATSGMSVTQKVICLSSLDPHYQPFLCFFVPAEPIFITEKKPLATCGIIDRVIRH